jgi:hypothetical protein
MSTRLQGPNGVAYVYQGEGHDWVLEFWPRSTRKHPRKMTKRVFKNSAKQAAVIVGKQMTGLFKK